MDITVISFLPRCEQQKIVSMPEEFLVKDIFFQIDMGKWTEKDVLTAFNGKVCFAGDRITESGELQIFPMLNGG